MQRCSYSLLAGAGASVLAGLLPGYCRGASFQALINVPDRHGR